MTTQHGATRLFVEQLEDRRNPAGNVSVALIGTQLFVQGDSFDNAVGVYQDASGNITVVGGSGTTINGMGSVFVGNGVPTEISIQGGFGNDLIDVRGLVASNAMLIDAGPGNDGVAVNNVSATYLTTNLGDGSDWLQISGVVAFAVDISGGTGFDVVQNRGVSTTWGGFRDFEWAV